MGNIAATLSLNVPAITALCIGPRGAQILAGIGDPSILNPGLSGDFYIDTLTADFYGPKTTSWSNKLFTLSYAPSSSPYTILTGNTAVVVPVYGNNKIIGSNSNILGGSRNYLNGINSGIIGGSNNSLTANNSFIIGSNIISTLANYVLTTNLSSNGVIYAGDINGVVVSTIPGSSNLWNSTYTSTNKTSGSWDSAAAIVTPFLSQASNNITGYSLLTANSANWATATTSYITNSSNFITRTGSFSAFAYTINGTSAAIQPISGINNATGSYSNIDGGNCNTASGNYSTITGGYSSNSLGNYSLAGGVQNTASGYASIAIGGNNNVSNGLASVVIGGSNNSTNNYNNVVIIGSKNISASAANTLYTSNIALTGNITKIGSRLPLTLADNTPIVLSGGIVTRDIFSDTGLIGTGTNQLLNAYLSSNGTGYFSSRVGIGISKPTTTLDVSGTGRFSTNVYVGSASSGLFGDGANLAIRGYSGATKVFSVQTYSGATTAATITNSGYLGLAGNTSPSVALDVGTGNKIGSSCYSLYDTSSILRNAIYNTGGSTNYTSIVDGTNQGIVVQDQTQTNNWVNVKGGNVGIGTGDTASTTRLTVSGETYSTYVTENQVTLSANPTTSIDVTQGGMFLYPLFFNTTLSFINVPPAPRCTTFALQISATSAALYSVTWPVAIKWPSGTAPTITRTAGKVDTFVFTTYNGGAVWYGFIAGQNA